MSWFVVTSIQLLGALHTRKSSNGRHHLALDHTLTESILRAKPGIS